jgi:mRNA-degrading endonuclease YafQ of YafQ-DinJ toxin-antitoxin module
MYSIDYTNRFKKDLKRCQKRGLLAKETDNGNVTSSQTG